MQLTQKWMTINRAQIRPARNLNWSLNFLAIG